MKLRLEDKRKAIELRIQGNTYREIINLIPNLPKSTLSGWLKNVKLTPKQKERLNKNIKKITYNARVKSAWTKKKTKEKKIKNIFKQAEKEYLLLAKNELFLIGLILYWAEGNRKTEMFQFTNSDPRAIKAMLNWLTKICKIPKKDIKIRLYIHKIYAHENHEKFWSEITKIPIDKFQKTIYKPTPHKIKKKLDYKGCIQLRILKTNFYWKVMAWIDILTKKYKFI